MDENKMEKGFISKKELLKYVSEEEIFSLVFGFEPKEYQYVTSPFRKDTRPGCWFSIDASSGKLRFIDFANTSIINNIKMTNIDCFDAVQIYYKLPNFYKTLEFIKEKLIDNKSVKNDIRVVRPVIKKEVEIFIDVRDFDTRDKFFWEAYNISKQNLIDDKVFPVKKYKVTNTKAGDIIKRLYDPCYCYSDFDDGRKKLYRPYNKNKRFITNCKADDIGQINNLPEFGRQLVISKSYKDCRVLRNEGYNCVWFQNEGMIPSDEILIDLCNRFNKIVVFFDNDKPGIEASIKVTDKINSLKPNKCSNLYLPVNLISENITDPSDLIKIKGYDTFKQFLYYNL